MFTLTSRPVCGPTVVPSGLGMREGAGVYTGSRGAPGDFEVVVQNSQGQVEHWTQAQQLSLDADVLRVVSKQTFRGAASSLGLGSGAEPTWRDE